MDIPGKLREDLKRIYGANDPLNYIEDVRVESRQTTGFEEDALIVKLRVPTRMEKYVASTSFSRVLPPDVLNSVFYGTHCLGNWGVPEPKPVEYKKHNPMPVTLPMPKRIIYSGPKTIVIWPDGSKTMVSLMEGQEHDEYGAFCAAVVKKMFGATHKAKKFLESVSVRPAPKPKKVKEEPIQVETVQEELIQEEVVPPSKIVQKKDKYADMETIPMPSTEDPDWGRKHWCPDAPVLAEEDSCDVE